jgi:hypothetical protein
MQVDRWNPEPGQGVGFNNYAQYRIIKLNRNYILKDKIKKKNLKDLLIQQSLDAWVLWVNLFIFLVIHIFAF